MKRGIKPEIGLMPVLFLILFLGAELFAQKNKEYIALSKFRKWGIIAGPVLYNKGKIYPQYGDYSFENFPIWSYNAGIEYDFYPDRKWSVITGIIVALEPVYNIQCTFRAEDIYDQFEVDFADKYRAYAMPSMSAPLLIRLNIQVNKRLFANFISGLKVRYFPPGEQELSVVFHNRDDTESREEFYLYAASPDNSFQGSFVTGAGLSFAFHNVLLKSNLVYSMDFQNTMEGYYEFKNLLTSPPSGGDYESSGNFLGLLFLVSIAKNKKKYQY